MDQTGLTLNRIYKKYHSEKYLENDPLCIPRAYLSHNDREIIAWLGALFALGGVKQIRKSLNEVIDRFHGEGLKISNVAVELAKGRSPENAFQILNGFKHRFYVDRDVLNLIFIYGNVLLEFGGLQQLFEKNHSKDNETVELALAGSIREMQKMTKGFSIAPGKFFDHLLTTPETGGVCKRWVMFLKWMVRKDGIDLGFWSNSTIRRDQLVIPLDVHVSRLVRDLKLLTGKSQTWKSAVEATRGLKKYDPMDPTRFDFALCRYGMFENRGGKNETGV